MSIVCKLFINNKSESPNGECSYQLGAVCRGEENKSWAAATPSGSMKQVKDPVLDKLWADKDTANEVLVHVIADLNGTWLLNSCEFTYGGCQVKFRQKDSPWGTLDLTINASEATGYMRRAFAASLNDGKPAAFTMEFRAP